VALQEEVIAVVSRVIKTPASDLSAESGLGSVGGWDSMNHTSLVLELENVFDVAFDFDELDRIVTVAAIVESLQAKGVSR
jgi:acyl carrier protein